MKPKLIKVFIAATFCFLILTSGKMTTANSKEAVKLDDTQIKNIVRRTYTST